MTCRIAHAGSGRKSVSILGAALLTLALALVASGRKAEALSSADLIGRWCGDTTTYVFTPTKLTVTFLDGSAQKILTIKSMDVGAADINVFWNPPYGGNTIFQQFTGSTMIQAANTSGDNGPQRSFHRC